MCLSIVRSHGSVLINHMTMVLPKRLPLPEILTASRKNSFLPYFHQLVTIHLFPPTFSILTSFLSLNFKKIQKFTYFVQKFISHSPYIIPFSNLLDYGPNSHMSIKYPTIIELFLHCFSYLTRICKNKFAPCPLGMPRLY